MSDDEPDPRLATALARHQLVSAYIADDHPHGRRSARLAEIVSRSWLGPDGEPMAVAPETLRKWIRAYRRHGFAGLFDKERPRTGVRALPEDARKRAVELKQAVPERSLERIIAILEDEGLVTAEEQGGKRVFTLTEDGTAEVARVKEARHAPWTGGDGADGADDPIDQLRTAYLQLGAAARQVADAGTADQQEAARALLDGARKAIYGILAED